MIKFKRVACLITAALILYSVPCSAAGPLEGGQILALGDSITTGYLLDGSHSDVCYANLVGEAADCVVINRAIDGNTAQGLLMQLQVGNLNWAIRESDIVTITCGGNDMLAFLEDTAEKMLEELYQKIQEYMPAGKRADDYEDVQEPAGTTTETSEHPSETQPAEQEVPTVDLDRFYELFEDFVTGIDQSFAYIEEAKAGAPLWERMAYLAYESIVEYALSNVSAELIDFTESDAYAAALAEYAERMLEITSYIKDINPDIQIIIATQYNPYGEFSSRACRVIRDFVDAGVKKLNAVITENAETGGYRTTDVYSAFVQSESNLCNASEKPLLLDVHPNLEGHEVIAKCILEGISGAQM